MNRTAENMKIKNKGHIVASEGPVCPYCGTVSILRPESIVYPVSYSGKNYWVCGDYPYCNSYVGTHGHGEWMNFPLGRLADQELRLLKKQAHTLFDTFWKSGTVTRGYMYEWMKNIMSLHTKDAHIGELDNDKCRTLIGHLNNLFDTIKIKAS